MGGVAGDGVLDMHNFLEDGGGGMFLFF